MGEGGCTQPVHGSCGLGLVAAARALPPEGGAHRSPQVLTASAGTGREQGTLSVRSGDAQGPSFPVRLDSSASPHGVSVVEL